MVRNETHWHRHGAIDWGNYNCSLMDNIKKLARERGQKLKLPYAGALLPAEAHAYRGRESIEHARAAARTGASHAVRDHSGAGGQQEEWLPEHHRREVYALPAAGADRSARGA